MIFRSRSDYTNWVFRTFIRPSCAFWNSLLPGGSEVYSFKAVSDHCSSVPLVASFGTGVAGCLQIAFKHARRLQRAPVWLAASRAEREALSVILENAEVAVVPYPMDHKYLKSVRSSIGTPNWQKAKRRFFAEHKLDPSLPTFYFSGRITPSKGVGDFISAVNRQRFKVQLVLAGMRERQGFQRDRDQLLYDQIRSSRFCRTIVLGAVSRVQNYRYITFADSTVALSTDATEDFGFLPRQSLALGTPSIITNWGGLKDIRLPAVFDRKFIYRSKVKMKSDGQFYADLLKFRLDRYVTQIRVLTKEDRKRVAEWVLKENQVEMRRGLAKAVKLQRSLLGKPSGHGNAKVRFSALSRRIVMNCLESGQQNAALHFPHDVQFRLMT